MKKYIMKPLWQCAIAIMLMSLSIMSTASPPGQDGYTAPPPVENSQTLNECAFSEWEVVFFNHKLLAAGVFVVAVVAPEIEDKPKPKKAKQPTNGVTVIAFRLSEVGWRS